MPPVELTLPFAAAFGLIVGSYLNVVIYRLPRGMSTVRPASRCPRCVMPIRPFDNVPILGYLWLLARCRDCGLPISPRYPMVEASVGAWFALVHLRAGDALEHVVASLFGAFLLVLALIDFDHQRVPIGPTALVAAIGLGLQPWIGWAWWSGAPSKSALLLALAAAGVGGLGALAISEAGRWFGIAGGLALGDAYALALIGAVLGPRGLMVAFLLGGALALLTYAPRLAIRRRFLDEPIPFVTFLSIGAAVALLVGPLAKRI